MPQVKDLTQAAILAAGGLVIVTYAGQWARLIGGLIRQCMMNIDHGGGQLWPRVTQTFWQVMRPTFVATLTCSIGFNLLRQRGVPGFRLPKFDLDRCNPLRRLGNLFGGGQGIGALAFSFLKLIIVALVCGSLMLQRAPRLLQHVPVSLGVATHGAFSLVGDLFFRGCVALLVLGTYDSWRSWVRLERRMTMSSQEVRDEVKEQVGDPAVRGRIKSKARELLKKRMLLRVPKADVVVVNPTHVAVALVYDERRMQAPEVVAKGAGAWAERIRAVARRHGVAIIQDPPLARALYERVEIATPVPADLYQATAVVIAHVFKLRRRMV